MNEYIPFFALTGVAIFFGFAFTYQNYGFLKEDIKYLEKRLERLEKEIMELRYRRDK